MIQVAYTNIQSKIKINCLLFEPFRGDTHMTSILKELGWMGEVGLGKLGVKAKMRCYRTQGGRGLASVLHVQSLFFLLKKIGFAPWPCIMLSQTLIYLLLTRNLLFDTDTRKWSHTLMISMHVCGINWMIEPVVNLNVMWLGFVFVLISFAKM